MRQLLAAIATGLFFLAAPAFGQDRIPVATLNGETIWLDEILAIAETLPPEYQQAGLPGLYPQLIDKVANARLSAAAGRAALELCRAWRDSLRFFAGQLATHGFLCETGRR